MLRRPQTISLITIAVIMVVLMNLPPRFSEPFKIVLSSTFFPLFGLASTADEASETVRRNLLTRSALIRQNQALQETNRLLQIRLMQGEEAMRENDRLRELLEFERRSSWPLLAARVVGRDPANWWRTIRINRGSEEGLSENQAVITADGLVGRLSSVGLGYSQVTLVGDPECRVSALVRDTQDFGIVGPLQALPPLQQGLVQIKYLAETSQVQPGQTVVTSGLGGLFPEGIVIGKIVDSYSVGYGLYTEARLKLAADMNRLEYVWVITL